MNDFSAALTDIFPTPITPRQILDVVHVIRVGLSELSPGGPYPNEWRIDQVACETLLAWCDKYERICEKELGIQPRFTHIS